MGGTRGLLESIWEVREAYQGRYGRYARPTRVDMGGTRGLLGSIWEVREAY